MSIFVGYNNIASWCDNLHLPHVICCQAILGCKDRMPSASDVSSYANSLASSTNNDLVMLVCSDIYIPHLRSTANGDGISLQDLLRAIQLILPFVVSNFVQIMGPYGERAWRIGAAEVVVASILDVEADIVLACWEIWLENSRFRHCKTYEPNLPKSIPILTCSAVDALTT